MIFKKLVCLQTFLSANIVKTDSVFTILYRKLSGQSSPDLSKSVEKA